MISYMASAHNISDRISHKFKVESINAEWTLHDHDFKIISKLWNHTPDTDLFASHNNHKFKKFVSWRPCVDATHVDVFTLNWRDIKAYLFPTFPCISSKVCKCIDDQVTIMCGIFPMWPTKAWYPTLMCLVGGTATLLPREASKRLFLPWDPEKDILWVSGWSWFLWIYQWNVTTQQFIKVPGWSYWQKFLASKFNQSKSFHGQILEGICPKRKSQLVQPQLEQLPELHRICLW